MQDGERPCLKRVEASKETMEKMKSLFGITGWGMAVNLLSLQAAVVPVEWSELPPLPDAHGYAGPFAGVSNDILLVAGGANFPDGPPWEGGSKVWHDPVYALAGPEEAWTVIGQLPRPLGYGVSITWQDWVIGIGGSDADRHYGEVWAMRWDGNRLERIEGASLPRPLANAAGVVLGDAVYLAGGSESPSSNEASSGFWKLDLSQGIADGQWRELPSWPGPERILPVMAAQNGQVFLVSGARLLPDSEGGVTREFLKDAYAFDPGEERWRPLTGPPVPFVAAPNPGISVGYSDILFMVGDDGEYFFRQDEMRTSHPGFPVGLYRYHSVTDRWSREGDFPRVQDPNQNQDPRSNGGRFPPVTTPVVSWHGQSVLPSGEIRPTVRTPKVVALRLAPAPSVFGTANWIVLTLYLGVLVVIGVRCARRESGTETFFLGGRRVPWWAAGLSIFSTMLSAITYLAIPARAYASDWSLFLVNMTVFAVIPIVVVKYLPVLRSENLTTVYEFLARRFDTSVQKFGSASFILFQMGRMGIVLLLPALALSAVTGIELYLCIALMGVLATLYTVVGGIEAVVWTDVLQTFVLLGGALAAVGMIIGRLDGGWGELIQVGQAAGKFHLANMEISLMAESIVVVVVGGFFSNALVPYSSDQAVVQRYLTTKNEAAARRSLWLGGIMVLPATLLFLLLGTGLYVFFGAFPESLAPIEKPDQILAWFIASEMPAGLAGLVIAGVFAASMSSLDSSMHSIATTVITDWWKPKAPAADDGIWLGRAKRVTLVAGAFGTVSALFLAGMDIQFLWDFFLGLIGLVGGTLAGVMAVAVFFPRVASRHVWCGIVVAISVLVSVKFFSQLPSLLYGVLGVGSVVGIALLASILRLGETD